MPHGEPWPIQARPEALARNSVHWQILVAHPRRTRARQAGAGEGEASQGLQGQQVRPIRGHPCQAVRAQVRVENEGRCAARRPLAAPALALAWRTARALQGKVQRWGRLWLPREGVPWAPLGAGLEVAVGDVQGQHLPQDLQRGSRDRQADAPNRKP